MPRPTPLYDAPIDDADKARRRHTQLMAQREEDRLVCDSLHLSGICPRTLCRRTRACRGDPGACLETRGAHAPMIAIDYARLLVQADESEETEEDIAEAYAEAALAFRGWVCGMMARTART